MKVIEIRPCKKFKGAWVSFEAVGVEPAFKTGNSKADAISYSRGRFGGSKGEILVYDADGETVAEIIHIDGGTAYGQAQHG
jgi:hypothetical protein